MVAAAARRDLLDHRPPKGLGDIIRCLKPGCQVTPPVLKAEGVEGVSVPVRYVKHPAVWKMRLA